MSGNSKDLMKDVDISVRGDNHAPFGDHLNFEVKLNLHGPKEGRQFTLSNTHISLDRDSD